ncbi:MAG: plasmid pRiA4b ORF-3 family protein [Bacteroidales bacterium]|nr:plasmid pRiA4b ORF-3 family protein [Bacteroidales bacterium]
MVYKFKVLSDEDDKFFMDIEILSSQTFYDLHDLIQDELEYDRSHLASFYTASHSWRRLKEIPLMAINDKSSNTITMEKAVLADYVKDAHQKFIYVFDYINDRCFYLELIDTKPESPNMYYPVCTDFGGEIPPQIGKKEKRTSIFDDDEEDLTPTPSRKSLPILDEELEDIPEIPLDKDIVPPIDIELEEELEEDLEATEEEDFDDSFEDDEFDDEFDEFDEDDEHK